MEYTEILIKDKNNFNPMHIFECGQFFRYKKISENHYLAYSKDKEIEVLEKNGNFIIKYQKEDKEYFENFFDLKTDYSKIKDALKDKTPLLNNAISFGYGIRILKQDIFETIVSFIISANNNIKRIQKSIEFICENAGEEKNGYFAFPSLNELLKKDEEFFVKAGLGYRASYLVKTLKKLSKVDLNQTKEMKTPELKSWLEGLFGVGPKVADCILLFSYSRKDVFPVDTWIKKVYTEDLKGKEKYTKKIAKDLVSIFGDLSGYAQQYLFYFKRTKAD